LVTSLSGRRGVDLLAVDWVRGPNANSSDRLSYTAVIGAAGGRIALWADVMLAMPGATESSVVTCAEIRIQSLAAWPVAVANRAASRRRT